MAEGGIREISHLFCPVEGKPMQFAIVRNNLMNIEINRTCKYIEEGGGKFVGFDPTNNNQINLASKTLTPLINLDFFDIGFIKKCIKQRKLLDLRDFRLGVPAERKSGCIPPEFILSEPKCTHYVTAEEVLMFIKSL